MSSTDTLVSKPRLLKKSMSLLGFDFIVHHLADLARSGPGKTLCLGLEPFASQEEMGRGLQETQEMSHILGGAGPGDSPSPPSIAPFPLEPFVDVRALLGMASKERILEPQEILPFLPVLRNAEAVEHFFRTGESGFEALRSVAETCRSADRLRRKIEDCVDEQGQIKPTATPELEEAYKRTRGLYQRITKGLEEMIRDERYKPLLQDDYFTERENRFVLPVKAEQKNQVEGIVHDISASGQTYFIEPKPLVDLNNRLKSANLEVEMEIRRILRDITLEIAENGPLLENTLEGLSRLDFIYAKGTLAVKMGGTLPKIGDGCPLDLLQAGNPQLVLSPDVKVVRNDVRLDPRKKILVISGPNAGGKTVTLKTIGLMGLMVRAGLFIPVGEGSSLPFFPKIYADIGDDQSIEENLSTFSSHLITVNSILNQASAGSLVLLDELMISTDPREGSALAIAILECLLDLNVTAAATTHYTELKVFAQTHPGFENASVEYDTLKMQPTYRLFFDLPGNSSAIQMARRLGMAEEILAVAESHLVHGNERLAGFLSDLEKKKTELERERTQLEEKNRQMDLLVAETESRLRGIQEERTAFEKERKQKLRTLIEPIRARFGELIRESEKAKTQKERVRIRNRLEKEIHDLDVDEIPPETKPRDLLGEGDPVYVKGLNVWGHLMEKPKKGKRVRIQSDAVTVSANWENIVGVDRVPGRPKSPTRPAPVRTKTPKESETDCDVRGLFPEEALEKTIRFLDAALRKDRPLVKIIHGHGKGILRKTVRDYLGESPYVESFRPGEPNQGGDGVTLVQLAPGEPGKKKP